jgi:CPA1 family monovalent cation:H+ antiporter
MIGFEVFAIAFDASILLTASFAIALALVARLAAVALPVLALRPFRQFSRGLYQL